MRCIYGILAGKPPYIQLYTVHIYGSGQPYSFDVWYCPLRCYSTINTVLSHTTLSCDYLIWTQPRAPSSPSCGQLPVLNCGR